MSWFRLCYTVSKHHSYSVESQTHSCDVKLCRRHGFYHAIESAHSTKCPFHHDASLATTKLGAGKGPRFAVIMRYFEKWTLVLEFVWSHSFFLTYKLVGLWIKVFEATS